MIALLADSVLILSDVDRRDLWCAWVAQDASQHAPDKEGKAYIMGMHYWFAGRLSGRHEGISVNEEIGRLIFSPLPRPDSEALNSCSAQFIKYQDADIRGQN